MMEAVHALQIGTQLRKLRKSHTLTLIELSEQTGISVSFLSEIERDLASPSLTTIGQLCAFYDIQIHELLKETTMPEETVHMQIARELEQLRRKITDNKPNDRSDADRNYAIVLTDLQKVAAFWMMYCQRIDEQ